MNERALKFKNKHSDPVIATLWVEINGKSVLIYESEIESEMELIEMNLLNDLTATIEVKPEQPETTKAIICLLVALGCKGFYKYVNIATVFDNAGYLYVKDGRINGWDDSQHQNRLDNEVLSTVKEKPKQKAKIVMSDGTEIELSDETWESVREAVK